MALRATKGLLAEFDAWERVPLLHELIVEALFFLSRSLMNSLRLTPIVVEGLERQYSYHALSPSNGMKDIEHFMGDPTVWIHQNELSQPGTSDVINSRLRPKPTLPSSMQMDPAAAPNSTSLL